MTEGGVIKVNKYIFSGKARNKILPFKVFTNGVKNVESIGVSPSVASGMTTGTISSLFIFSIDRIQCDQKKIAKCLKLAQK